MDSADTVVIDNLDLGVSEPVLIFLIVLVIFEIVLKAVALYRAGENQSKGWFTVLFILNTAGILPIIYLIISRKKDAGNNITEQ